MSSDTPDQRSCGLPQLLSTHTPTVEWLPEELKIYAQAQYRQIVDGEALLSRPYWRLGHALTLAKRSFHHGQWARYLADLGIDKTRASKARAIYRTFSREEDVAQLTVQEAYARRRQKEPSAPAASTTPQVVRPASTAPKLRTAVGKIARNVGTVIQDAAFTTSAEASVLIPAIRKAIRELETLLEFLEQQAKAESVEADATVLGNPASGSLPK